jgi:hypothetical protein
MLFANSFIILKALATTPNFEYLIFLKTLLFIVAFIVTIFLLLIFLKYQYYKDHLYE